VLVRSVHYSDYLEHDLCIQDEFTIPTSPCIMSSHWCIAGHSVVSHRSPKLHQTCTKTASSLQKTPQNLKTIVKNFYTSQLPLSTD
jgi:hypothetical protein